MSVILSDPPARDRGLVRGRHRPLVRTSPGAALSLVVACVAAMIAFTWPLFVVPGAALANLSGAQAPFVFALILPLVLVVSITQLTSSGIDAKGLAMLGVLTAVDAALRPLGAGVAGIETVFFIPILAGYVFGPGFAFLLGSTALFTSALLTSGVGPWLPYQMLATGLLGVGAGLLPRLGRRAEIVMLAGYGFVSGFVFGALMDLAFWPFGTGQASGLSYVAGAALGDNLLRFLAYNLATAMGWNLGRALTNVVLISLLGPGLLLVFRRAARKAVFDAPRGHNDRPPPT